MKGDLKINKKFALYIVAAMGFYAMADYVSLVDVESSGGVSIISGVSESDLSDLEASLQAKIYELETTLQTQVDELKEKELPIGTVAMWGNSSLPTGWIEMNGQSTSAYSELAAIYGSTLPDLRGEFVRGWDNGRGVDSGRTLKGFQNHQLQSIVGSVGLHGTNSATTITSTSGVFYSSGSNSAYHTNEATPGATSLKNIKFDSSRVANSGSETRPRSIALMYIVKAE